MTISKEAVEAALDVWSDYPEWRERPVASLWSARMSTALTAALPFLALRPAPSQSDEERARSFTEDAGNFDPNGEPYLDRLAASYTTVRAEERERIEAAVRSAPCLDEDGKVIATSVVIDAIRAMKPPAALSASPAPGAPYAIDIQVGIMPPVPYAPDPAEAMREKCEAIARMSDYSTKSMTSQLARRIANQIAALKGNGEGL